MNSNAPIRLATLYSKRARHNIDSSNRIMLPSEWRGQGNPDQFFVILSPSDDHLMVYPPEGFKELLEELRNSTADKSRIPAMERELSDRVRQVSLDRFGRLPLPREFTDKAGIKKQGELVGRFSMFEVWECNKHEQERATRGETTAALNTRLLNR